MGKKPKGGVVRSDDDKIFSAESKKLKEEGDKRFAVKSTRDALELYKRALELALPEDRADIHSNRAACFLIEQQYDRAVVESSMALETSPAHATALVRRAKAYEMRGSAELALQDLDTAAKAGVLSAAGSKMRSALKAKLAQRGQKRMQPSKAAANGGMLGAQAQQSAQQQAAQQQSHKLTFVCTLDDDAREVSIPVAQVQYATLLAAISKKFPTAGPLAIKYPDMDGDLVTMTSRNDLHRALHFAASKTDRPAGQRGLTIPLTVVKVEASPVDTTLPPKEGEAGAGELPEDVVEIDEWLLDFANLFRKHLPPEALAAMSEDEEGREAIAKAEAEGKEPPLDLRKIGMPACHDALDAALADDASPAILIAAANKFQEAAAAAVFNHGNVFVCDSRKRLEFTSFSEDKKSTSGSGAGEVDKVAVESFPTLESNYHEAAKKYQASLDIKADFYESAITWGQQAFERAKLLNMIGKGKEGALIDAKRNWAQEADAMMDLACEKYELALSRIPPEEPAAAAADAAASAGEDTSVTAQVHVLLGNVLFERSVMMCERGEEGWKQKLDQAIERFRLGKCQEADIENALASHVGIRKERAAEADKA
mmetsp:Transcript_29800/g.97089  ORF Transcript_29800/g.97089 Transcript_29800/m.97089 type:complete len:599 (+) Transcript_29800:283-2079(+)